MADGKPQFNTGGIPIIAVQVLLPVVLAVIAGYGSVKYSSGETTQQIRALQQQVEANKQEVERIRSTSVTREEMRLFIEQARQDLQDIKMDVREIRNRR